MDGVAAEGTGLSHKGPGLEGKNLNFFFFPTSNGEPRKTSEQERGKEQQRVVSGMDTGSRRE